MRLAKKQPPRDDLQNHPELEKHERVREQRVLKNLNRHPLHDDKRDRVNDQPIALA